MLVHVPSFRSIRSIFDTLEIIGSIEGGGGIPEPKTTTPPKTMMTTTTVLLYSDVLVTVLGRKSKIGFGETQGLGKERERGRERERERERGDWVIENGCWRDEFIVQEINFFLLNNVHGDEEELEEKKERTLLKEDQVKKRVGEGYRKTLQQLRTYKKIVDDYLFLQMSWKD